MNEMTEKELKELIRDAVRDTTEMSDMYYEVLADLPAEDVQRCNELLTTATGTVTWEGDKP